VSRVIGAVLSGKYRIDRKIGEGGFGVVYRAFDTNLKRDVAVKVLKAFGADESFKRRFYRESESLAQLSHANIVTVFDCGEHDEQPFLVMELVTGPSLKDLVDTAAVPLSTVLTLSIQIARAMAYAHGRGVVHRDLTLNNILLSEIEGADTQAKIVDFGLAKLMNVETQTTGNMMQGTPFYLSPEHILEETVDERSDIYSFGVGLYRMINGRFPFEAEHPAALMYSIVNEECAAFTVETPEALERCIRWCLEKDPAERPGSFSELAERIQAVQRACESCDDVSSATWPGTGTFADRSSKRNPYLNRVMIKNPADFFGREREVRKIYSRLDAPHPQSMSIVGERRVGKSSLLNYIYQRKIRKQHMQHYRNAIFVYLDFQNNVDFDIPKFIDFLFSVFSYETEEGRAYASREKTLDQLKQVVKELHEKGKRIIVLMDEFEVITRNEKFEEDFFSFLRSLANSYHVAYVTSSCEELQNMCHNKDIADSPFFNIFSNLPLRTFSHDEALELITVPSEREGVSLARHADRIIDLAGYFPMYLQIACSSLFEYLIDNPDSEPDWQRVSRIFMEEADPHFNFIWERLDEAERDNLGRIATGKQIGRKFAYLNENLVRRGYLLETGGGPALFSSPFKAFVLQQMAVASGKRSILSSLIGKIKNT
jgi:AAA+ ATPase superfamily predicted ATPase